MNDNYKLTSQEAFEKVKAERANKEGIDTNLPPLITGEAAANLRAEMRYRDSVQAKAQRPYKIIR